MRVEFRDHHSGDLLYDADLSAIPQTGEAIMFPSGRAAHVAGPPQWHIGEREDQHRIVVLVTTPR